MGGPVRDKKAGGTEAAVSPGDTGSGGGWRHILVKGHGSKATARAAAGDSLGVMGQTKPGGTQGQWQPCRGHSSLSAVSELFTLPCWLLPSSL
jgi:hypothetical protein